MCNHGIPLTAQGRHIQQYNRIAAALPANKQGSTIFLLRCRHDATCHHFRCFINAYANCLGEKICVLSIYHNPATYIPGRGVNSDKI